MFKHRLMLSVATVALVSGSAYAAGPTSISTKTTDPLKTSTSGDITITTDGSIVDNTATPLITIDSSNTVTNNGKLTDANTAGATAYFIDASGGTPTYTSTITDAGTISLTGTGDSKRILHLDGGATFNGDITFSAGSIQTVNGDGSVGILLDDLSTLNGDLTFGGAMTITSTGASTTTSSGIIGMDLLGDITGNVVNSGSIVLLGNGAQGIVVGPGINFTGGLVNAGSIQVTGIQTPSTTKTNPEAGSAVVINSSITGGFLNTGSGQIASLGTQPALQITPTSTTNIVLGAVPTAAGFDTGNAFGYGFINHGLISGGTIDNNISPTIAGVSIGGSTIGTTVTINKGLLNTDIISAQSNSAANSTTTLQPTHAIGVFVGSFATVPEIDNIGAGVKIQGLVSGPADNTGGGPSTGTGIYIDAVGSVPTINNMTGASIIGSAQTSDPTISSLQAFGIEDKSGTLTLVNNSGVISATGTTLDNNAQTFVAIDVSANTSGVTINNGDPTGVWINNYTGAAETASGGVIVGDVRFGSGNDTLNIMGTSAGTPIASSVTGNVLFGGSSDNTHFDQLNIGDNGTLNGGITSNLGHLNVSVAANGTLGVNNTLLGVGTRVNDLDVAADGTLNIAISQALSSGVIVANDEITLAHQSNFGLSFGSFVNSDTDFVLLDTPNGNLHIPDAADYATNFANSIPFLYTGSLCTHNVLGSSVDCGAGVTAADSQLILTLQQKTVGTGANQLNLTGYAQQMFPLANAVLPLDTALGAAVIQGVTNLATAQSVYDQFAPIATGSARAIAISLTDQASGTIGARQRQLRLYGKQPGESTLWGIEYAQFLKDPGETIPAAGGAPAGLLSGYKDHGFGFSIGGDGGSAKGGWYGGALTFYTGDAGELGNRNGNTQSEWYMASGYTDWRGRGLFFDSNLNVGIAQFKGKRNLIINLGSGTTFDRTAVNRHTGLLVGGGITTGAMLNYGSTTLSPQFSLDALTMREEGYTESGGGTPGSDAFDLIVKPSYGSSLRGFFGTDIREDIDTGDFFLQPSARVGYRYDFVDGAQKVNASFVGTGTPGTPFSLVGPDPDRGNIVASLGLGATTDTWSLNVSYDYVRGSNGALQQNGQFTLVGRI